METPPEPHGSLESGLKYPARPSRKERNRVLAAESRKRNREYVEALEYQVVFLANEVLKLRDALVAAEVELTERAWP